MSKITDWRTSSFSGADNNDCVQVANTLGALRDSKDPSGETLHADVSALIRLSKVTGWRTSSFSGADNNACVQVANTLGALRDSKNPSGGALHLDVSDLIKTIKGSAAS